MQALFVEGRIALLILGIMLLEGVALLAHHRRTGGGLTPAETLRLLIPGACLVGALYAALVGGWWGWIALALAGSLVAHVADIAQRWR